ncbi:hypothetical protein M5K25_004980 [Dendrobium thyrsiflorum]|uniref:Uncharacterized protein n=1 Tax=Dendrobium thyrsiflorum TaxID=117978 RepID=A0ABD0VNF3_DENTH
MDGRFAALEDLMKKMIDDKQKPALSETIGGHGRGGDPIPSRGRENPEVEVLEGDDGRPPLEPLSREELSRGYNRQEAKYVGRREEFYRRGVGFERIQRRGADFEGGMIDFHRRGADFERISVEVLILKGGGRKYIVEVLILKEISVENFYEDLFEELSKYGELESLNVCDNLADHMVGNVYVQFREEEHAANAVRNLTGRFYAGRPIIVDFSPVTDFREATCRQYEENTCNRGGYCNFMHLKKISRELRRQLFGRSHRRHSRSRSRSHSPHRRRNYEDRRRHQYDDRDRQHDDRGRRPRSRSPGHRKGRSRSPGGRNNRSPVREGSAERRAKIEQWNREREQAEQANKPSNINNHGSNGSRQNGGHHHEQPYGNHDEYFY